jgi:N-acyl-D-aspartate/D-glutamate deacylase
MLTGSHACVAVVYLRHWALSVILVCLAAASCAGQTPESAQLPFDVVISNAHVMDPASGTDVRGRNIGIRGRSVAAITADAIRGLREIDAAGRVVAPGFIDILSYNPDRYGAWFKIADGVTTNLAMHGAPTLDANMGAWYRRYTDAHPPVNFGGALLYTNLRRRMKIGSRSPTPQELAELMARADQAINDGAIGISMSPEYDPAITTAEIEAMMTVAKRRGVSVFFHVRYASMEGKGTNLDALREVIEAARKTGASAHVVHINSTGGTFSMGESLRMLEEARRGGLDVTACTYPYNFWASPLDMARFNPGWQKRFRIGPGDLQIAGTSERLTPASFQVYRKTHKLAVAYAIPDDDVVQSLRTPWVMIGSDAILEAGNNNHPRASGTFTRVLAVYVRERHVLSLMDALAKMTILPARRLEAAAPALRLKGRLQVGADADLVIFDPDTVRDQATVEHPDRFSTGMDYVLVSGQVVKDPRGINRKATYGEPISSQAAAPELKLRLARTTSRPGVAIPQQSAASAVRGNRSGTGAASRPQ